MTPLAFAFWLIIVVGATTVMGAVLLIVFGLCKASSTAGSNDEWQDHAEWKEQH